jgi:hypothetical protein
MAKHSPYAVARTLARIAGGIPSLDTVHVGNHVAIVVGDHAIDLCRTLPGRYPTYERLPAGLTCAQIVERALAVAALQPGQTLPALGRAYGPWTLPVAA